MENNKFIYDNKVFVIEKRCNGDCCKFFTISGKTKVEIHELRIETEKEILNKKMCKEDYEYLKDIIFIDEMLISLGKFKTNPLIDDVNNAKFDEKLFPDGVEYFTCKHFDMDNNLCRAYDKRPNMCKNYPHNLKDGKCEYKNCTYKFYVEKELIEKK